MRRLFLGAILALMLAPALPAEARHWRPRCEPVRCYWVDCGHCRGCYGYWRTVVVGYDCWGRPYYDRVWVQRCSRPIRICR